MADSKDNKSGLANGTAATANVSFVDVPVLTFAQKLGKKFPQANEAFQRAVYVKLAEINEYLQTTVDTLIVAIKNASSRGEMSLSIRASETLVYQSLYSMGALERTPQDPSQFVMHVPRDHTTEQIFAVLSAVFIECNANSKAGDTMYSIVLSRSPYSAIEIGWNTKKEVDAH
jgi:hypothetical protein